MGTIKKRRLAIRRGRPPKGKEPGRDVLRRLYQEEGKAIRDIAEELGCSKDMIFRSLKTHGIEARSNARRSSLAKYPLEYLENGIRDHGLRGFARILKIDKSAIINSINIRKSDNKMV